MTSGFISNVKRKERQQRGAINRTLVVFDAAYVPTRRSPN